MTTVKPDFFIVGAPRCGTTAMSDYLRQHPDVFMPSVKEIHHFAGDLLKPDDWALDRDTYLALFNDAHPHQLCGEASVFYMLSERAAANIYAFNPAAKIIIMLRNPVEMLYSLHARHVYNLSEPLTDFAAALAAEPARREGTRFQVNTRIPKSLWYREVAGFTQQIQRIQTYFAGENIHIVIYDDFEADTLDAYRATLGFLGVDTTFTPHIRLVNANQELRFPLIKRFLKSPPRWYQFSRQVVPKTWRRRASQHLQQLDARRVERPPLAPELRRQLQTELLPEVEQLSDLLGRDLTHWCRTQ